MKGIFYGVKLDYARKSHTAAQKRLSKFVESEALEIDEDGNYIIPTHIYRRLWFEYSRRARKNARRYKRKAKHAGKSTGLFREDINNEQGRGEETTEG